MKRKLFYFLSFILLNIPCFAGSNVNNFYSLTKSTIQSSIAEIISKSNDSITSCTFSTSLDEYDSFLEPIVAQILQEKGVHYLGKLPIKNTVHLRMQLEEFTLKWNSIQQFPDSVEETASMKGRILTSTNNVPSNVVSLQTSYNAIVSVNDARRTMKVLPSIIVSELPTSQTSLVEEILTPVLYLGTAVITLLLLFTVRTQ